MKRFILLTLFIILIPITAFALEEVVPKGKTAGGVLKEILVEADGTQVTSATGSATGPDGAPYALERDNIGVTSVNFAFGFTSKKIAVLPGIGNSDSIAVDWGGTAAVCPAVNSTGDARLAAGTNIILDNHQVTSISVIACSGTQSVNVLAWQ